MLKKRIIPCLDVKEGRTVKGVSFESLADAGDPVQLAGYYAREGADELVFLDITATSDRRKTITELVERVAADVYIPFTVGGGITTVEDVDMLLRAGADKISVNTAAVLDRRLITSIASKYGSQCVVVAIDTAFVDGEWYVFTFGGRTNSWIKCTVWAATAEKCGAGEILLTSIGSDGSRNGFAHGITQAVCDAVNVPVIASGGAGTQGHFRDLFRSTDASAALAASVFHYGDIRIGELKQYLKKEKIAVR